MGVTTDAQTKACGGTFSPQHSAGAQCERQEAGEGQLSGGEGTRFSPPQGLQCFPNGDLIAGYLSLSLLCPPHPSIT